MTGWRDPDFPWFPLAGLILMVGLKAAGWMLT